MKKIIALVLALVMVLAVTAASAATIKVGAGGESAAEWTATGGASITVTLPTTASGAVANNTYKIYKVFDATAQNIGTAANPNWVISYTKLAGASSIPSNFTADTNGNVTYSGSSTSGELDDDDIAALRTYVAGLTPIATVTTSASDTSFTVEGLEYGYYFINTTTGTAVTVDSTKPNAAVHDKNEIPPVDKTITGGNADTIDAAGKKAIAQVGSNVEFTVSLTIKNGAENYIFYDKMDTGLSYNNDVKVYTSNPAGLDATARAAIELAATATGGATNFTVTNTAGGTGDYAYTFKVALADAYVAAHENQTLYFVYTAEVTNDALTTDSEQNTAWLDYGHIPGENHTPKTTVDVYSAKITIKKVDGTASPKTPLSGAGFILRRGAGDQASPYEYYTFSSGDVSWVTTEPDATMVTLNSTTNDYEVIFKGLPAGTYTLIEKVVPQGYNKAADQTFTINPANHTGTNADKVFLAANLEQEATVDNMRGTELPSTGGIGTTIFYILGGLLVIGAAVILVARRKAQD